MTDLEKRIWQASRGDRFQLESIITELDDRIIRAELAADAMLVKYQALIGRLDALEAKRGPGRPKGS